MFARVTPYRMKPGSKAAATKIADSLRDKIMALPGQQMFLNVFNDDTGTGYVVSTTDIGEATDETNAKVKALWSAFSEYLLDDPTPQTFDVMQNWSK